MHKHETDVDMTDIDIKPQIDYPCTWRYRVIGLSKDFVIAAIAEVFQGRAEVSEMEHKSSHGKYIALNCAIEVQSDTERLAYFNGLIQRSGIVMVI